MKKELLKSTFHEKIASYERLGVNLRDALIQFLRDQNIDFIDVEFRVKTFDSFFDKSERKGYKDPIAETTDICGVRIVNYYPSDLEKISTIINNEFDIIESSNKQNELDEDRFGYRSLHFISTIKQEWLNAPNYRGLGGLKFEIQARTILMHGWAAISHKLAYKHERDVPKKFRRDLFRLSALIELADEQFERLRTERNDYSKSFVKSDLRGNEEFNPQDELNVDSLQALLDYYFPERQRSSDLSSLVYELDKLGLNLSSFNAAVISVYQFLDEIQKDENSVGDGDVEWAQVGAARTVLDLTNNEYFSRHDNGAIPQELLSVLSDWRGKIKQ